MTGTPPSSRDGGGDYTLIADTELAADAASISFAAIAATYAHLVLLFTARGDVAATSTVLAVRFNGDGGANYDWIESQANGAGTVLTQGTAETIMRLGSISADSAPANVFAQVRLEVFDYADPTTRKVCASSYAVKLADAANGHYTGTAAGFYRTAGAVDRIDLIPGAGNLRAGSRATLYGLS